MPVGSATGGARGPTVQRVRAWHAGRDGPWRGPARRLANRQRGVSPRPRLTRDYVSIASVVRLLPAIATVGQDRIYNVAAGSNTSHATIADRLRKDLGWQVRFVAEAPTVRLLPIDTSRLNAEFGPASGNLTDDLTSLLTLAADP